MKAYKNIIHDAKSIRLSTKTIQEILHRRIRGAEISDLSIQFNLDQNSVKLILQSNGYDCDSQNIPDKLKVSQKEIDKSKIQNTHNKNKSPIPSNNYQKKSLNNESLAKKFNISLDDVNQFFDRIRK